MGRAALLTLALALVWASPAAAAEVRVTVVRDYDFSLAFVDLHGAPGEANATVSGGVGAVVVHDEGAPLDAGRPAVGRVIVRLRGTSRCRPRGGYRIGAFTLMLPAGTSK